MIEKYLREQIIKDTGCLKEVFTDNTSIEYNSVLNPYTSGTQVNTHHSDKQEGKMLEQQIDKDGAGTNMADERQDNNIGYEAPNTKIMKSRSDGIRNR